MRKNRLIERLAVAYKFVRFGRGMCRIMTCGQCGSVYIRPIVRKDVDAIDTVDHIVLDDGLPLLIIPRQIQS